MPLNCNVKKINTTFKNKEKTAVLMMWIKRKTYVLLALYKFKVLAATLILHGVFELLVCYKESGL